MHAVGAATRPYLANDLHRIDAVCVPFAHEHDLSRGQPRSGAAGTSGPAPQRQPPADPLSARSRAPGLVVVTLPKLPLPMTLRRSKSSICNDVLVCGRVSHALSTSRAPHARYPASFCAPSVSLSWPRTTAMNPHASSSHPVATSPSAAGVTGTRFVGAFWASPGFAPPPPVAVPAKTSGVRTVRKP